jgi:hypothetical protein
MIVLLADPQIIMRGSISKNVNPRGSTPFSGLHQNLDRWQAPPEHELLECRSSVLLEQATDQRIHKRTIRATDSGEIQDHATAARHVQIGIDGGHPMACRQTAHGAPRFGKPSDGNVKGTGIKSIVAFPY